VHNVHPLPTVNAEANKTTPMKGTHASFTFDAPETMIRFTCNVHPWMNGYAGVVPHPFFAVTGANGAFELNGLPPGTYTLEAWHETLGTQTQQVTIAARQAQTISFTFAPKG
jgi:carboxypeptidase family protein